MDPKKRLHKLIKDGLGSEPTVEPVKQDSFNDRVNQSETAIELTDQIALSELTDLAAIVYSVSFLCLKIDALKKENASLKTENHKIKSRVGML
jgi:hypothetical protein